MNNHKHTQKGTTIIELILAVSIFAILIGIISINLSTVRTKATLHTTLTTIATNVKQQQKKAMFLHTEKGNSLEGYGVYFTPTSYTLFQGTVYDATNPSNFVVTLDTGLLFSPINLPSNTLLFATRSGEISNFSTTLHSVALRDQTTQEQKTIDMNKLGVITTLE